jgi:hypothetical protein
MIARPSAKFERPRAPYERRCVLVVPASEAGSIDPRQAMPGRKGLTYFTRGKVVDAVARGEMRWVDKFHNAATFTSEASGTWQKTRSGPVWTMQLVQGARGRYLPARQRLTDVI